MYYPKMYPRGWYGLRRAGIGLTISVLTLGGTLSFGLGQALGHWHAHAMTPTHGAASTSQQPIAGSALGQLVPSEPHPAAVVVRQAAPVEGNDDGEGSSHKKDHSGQTDGHSTPSPKDGNSNRDGGDDS